MSDLVPPARPGEQQRRPGFFAKFFLKEDRTPVPARPTQDVDLEDIKRKLGLSEPAPAPPAPTPIIVQEPAPVAQVLEPPAKLQIESWEEEPPAPLAPAKAPVWDAQEPPVVQRTVQVTDWSQEQAHETDAAPSQAETADAVQALPSFVTQQPIHHDAVDDHFAAVEQKEEKIATVLAKSEEHLDVPEWHLQQQPVKEDQYFILRNGHPIRSLRELSDALTYIDDDTLDHHITEHKNDFANWVQHVIRDADLAEQMRQATTRDALLAALQAHRQNAARKLTKQLRKQETVTTELVQGIKDVDALRDQLDRKARELSIERAHTKKIIKEALDKEVDRRLEEERDSLTQAVKDLDAGKKLYLAKAAEYDAKCRALDAREAKLATRETDLAQRQAQVTQQLATLREERAQAQDVLKEADAVRKDLASIAKQRAQTEGNLKEIAKREADLARLEATINQRERKNTEDLTRIKQEQAALQQQKAEHEHRMQDLEAKERAIAPMLDEVEQRRRKALDAEKQTIARIKEETKKLDGLRTRIERSLQSVLKNKEKAMYATELRKHLEQHILATKQEVVDANEKLKADAYKAYLTTAQELAPVGQPSSQDADVQRVQHLDLYEKVQQAKSALSRQDLTSAKRIYTELRDAFSGVDVNAPERDALYTSIRELYDDIRLAMLEQ